MNLRVAAPAGAQGTISGAILAARTPLSALLQCLLPTLRLLPLCRKLYGPYLTGLPRDNDINIDVGVRLPKL